METKPRTVSDFRTWFQSRGLKSSFRNRLAIKEFGEQLTWASRIPWRKDQRMILRAFQRSGWKEMVIQAIFGGGKTTMMLALVYDLILRQACRQHNIFICAFNCAIKNEIKKKTKHLGKLNIRTYDSLVYHMCSEMKFPTLRSLNFDTKRRYVVEHREDIPIQPDIKYVFLDEAQDLEISCLSILRHRFPYAQFMFVGDNFQSIQKEPRESILWHLLQEPHPPDRIIFKMSETPRVPSPILSEIRTALQLYYPEFHHDIQSWKSTTTTSSSFPAIEWKRFDQYSTMYKDILEMVRTRFSPQETMILTFSSAVTVRGTLGDVARFRRMFQRHGVTVNSNHKQMRDDCLFLTTSNSSKGLERRHVIAVLTFPLEAAFSNFSNDLVMNLITVASSRTKESLVFFVPAHQDRFSKVLEYFEQCPRPIKSTVPTIHSRKSNPFCYLSSDPFEMLQKEHSVTELLRQSILSFETRERLLHYIRHRESISLQTPVSSLLSWKTEEDCAFIGILFETLLLTSWTHQWPTFSLTDFSMHEVFQGHWTLLTQMDRDYSHFRSTHPHCSSSEEIRFQGSCHYAQLHLFAYHKIVMDDWTPYRSLLPFWKQSKSSLLSSYSLPTSSSRFKTQSNVSMPFVNGIIDALVETDKDYDIVEIKASRSLQWKTQALLQAILYGILSAKSVFRVCLLNVFAKQAWKFSLFLQKDLRTLRTLILQDILQWNLNCYLSKNRNNSIHLANQCFIDARKEGDRYTEISLLYFLSDTKARLHLWSWEEEESDFTDFLHTLSVYQSHYPFQALFHCPGCPSLPSSIVSTPLPKPLLPELLRLYPASNGGSLDWNRSSHTVVLYATSMYYLSETSS